MLMNKSTLLDPRLKSLAHLTEEGEATLNSLVDEIVTSSLQSTPISASVSSTTESTNDCNAELLHSPPTKKKKCALEKLLGDTFFSANPESSISVTQWACASRIELIQV